MRNIGRIFTDDLRYAASNIVALLGVLALCLLPAIYAWTSTAASWDPYANAGQMKVAVANSDEGYESALMPVQLNVGDRVVGNLRESESYGWEFVSEKEALDGVRSGEYYAAIIIPSNFSAKMMSVLSSDAEQASVSYYVNMKEHPVAPIMAGEGSAEVVEDIRVKFTDAVDEMALGLASDLMSFASADGTKDFGTRFVSRLDDLAKSLESSGAELRSVASLIDAGASLTTITASALTGSNDAANASGGTVAAAAEALNAAVTSAQTAASEVQQQIPSSSSQAGIEGVGADAAQSLASDVSELAGAVSSISNEASGVVASLQGIATSMADSTDSAAARLLNVRDDLRSAANKMTASASKVRKLQDDVAAAIAKGDIGQLSSLVGSNRSVVAQWLIEPLDIETQAMYPIENFGSAVAPFYAVLSIWAGAVLLVLVLKTDATPERLRRYEQKRGRAVRNYEQSLGRYLVFLVLSLVQASLVGLGDLFFLRIQCAHPLLFLAACWACALVFSSLAYTLALSFGNVGKALCLVLLVMQVVGAGGEYPAQMLGGVFQAISPLLPFGYGMSALQAAVAGLYSTEYLMSLLYLAVFLVPSLLLGLALRRPLVRFARYCDSKLSKTGFM